MAEITLSNRQRKSADRVAGIELMVPWPARLGHPPVLAIGEECDTTPAEARIARLMLEPDLGRADLGVRRVVIAHDAWKGSGPPLVMLAIEIAALRFFDATNRPPPVVMWATQAPGAPKDDP